MRRQSPPLVQRSSSGVDDSQDADLKFEARIQEMDMVTQRMRRLPDSVPDFRREALTIALAIVVEHIHKLPKDDLHDLTELVEGLDSTNSPVELQSIFEALLEILEQAPIRARPI